MTSFPSPSVQEAYTSDEKARTLASTVEPLGKKGALVIVPSNADIVAASVLAWRPRRLILVRTEGLDGRHIDAVFRWLEGWGLSWDRPRATTVPADPDEAGLGEAEFLPTLEATCTSFDTVNTVFVASGGTAAHGALLTSHAAAVGGRVGMIDSRYEDGKLVRGSASARELPRPHLVRHKEALRKARARLRDHAFASAKAVLNDPSLDRVPDTGALRSLTRDWIRAWEARDALLLSEALQHAGSVIERAGGMGRQEKTKAHRTLFNAANTFSNHCMDIETARDWSETGADPVPLVAELVTRARQERAGGRRNHAALLYYRVAEMCSLVRLVRDYRIRPGEGVADIRARWPSDLPGEASVPEDVERFLATFEAASGEKGRAEQVLLRPLGMNSQYALLRTFGEPLLSEGVTSSLRQLAVLRNKSIFAHGFEPVDPQALDHLVELVEGPSAGGVRIDHKGPGLLRLVASDGKAIGHLNKLLHAYRGPHLDDSGEDLFDTTQRKQR